MSDPNIRDLADELTEPHTHREPYHVWTGQRNRITHHHATTQHGLLRQLHDAAIQPTLTGTDEAAGAIPGSRPPLAVEALSRHTQITAAAQAWCEHLGLAVRATPESNIRQLAAATGRLDEPTEKALRADLRRWNTWCRVYLGLERIHTARGIRCPLAECATLGTLRINLTTSHALCTACGAAWDRDTIGVLANHIKTSRKATSAAPG